MRESEDKATLIFQGALVIALFLVGYWPVLATANYADIFTYETFGISPTQKSPISDVVRNYGLVVGAIVAIAIGTWRAVTAHQQARTAERGHFTERFTSAVDNIKDPHLAIRLGGINALSQLGEEAEGADYVSVIAIFSAFVRSPPTDAATRAAALTAGLAALQAFSNVNSTVPPNPSRGTQSVRRDVREIMKRLCYGEFLREYQFLDLSEADLSDANLSQANLIRANFSGGYLSGSDLSEANLSGADLGGANLSGAYLRDAGLSDANLSGANLSDADLSEANLSDADLRRADLSGTDFSDANLSGANLIFANLRRADFSDADLSDADLRDADLRRADLSGANLSGTDLRGANLSGGHLNGADLSGAYLYRANFSGGHLSGADLSGCHLSGVDLSRAHLSGSDLSRAHLSEADFSDAKLVLVDLSGADLVAANLSGADLSGAKYLTQAMLDTACTNPANPPKNLPKDNDGIQLIWRGKPCPEK